MTSRKRKIPNDADISALHKEWDEISCPICMDYPHNAVLILCTSHENGCKSFICDTSYRHSNCLDRFKKPVSENNNNTSNSGSNSCLKCPLCRGGVSGTKVVDEARKYLNLKSRTCSHESCLFSGNYRELRWHARRAHPTTRPTDIDPTRERDWIQLEHQREYGDIVSAIRSAVPGSVVFGDYAIENGDDRVPPDGGGGDGHYWRTAFFLFQMIGSMDPPPPVDRTGGVPTRHRRRRRRLLWGESLLGLQDDDDGDGDGDDDDDDDDDEEDNRSFENSRRRRRLTRYRSDEDRS